jgi:hypothetical protein
MIPCLPNKGLIGLRCKRWSNLQILVRTEVHAYKAFFDWSYGARVETLGQIHLAGALIIAMATNKPGGLQRCYSEQGIGRKVMIRLAEGKMRAVNWERRGRVGGYS